MVCFVFDLDDTLLLHHNNIHYEWIYEDTELSYHLDQCKGDKYVFTNGTRAHANKILEKMNLTDKFKRVFTREDFGYKPNRKVFESVDREIRALSGLTSGTSGTAEILFFDDLYANLVPAKMTGWSTCWIHPHCESAIFNENVDDGYRDIKEALRYINMGLKYK